ncbi:MAG TPA: hypothetical protein VKB31_06395 [Trueperaceae bacterium]|nr:hypothetical protein [Trueperaceae bacterium]
MVATSCPICEALLELDGPAIGTTIVCPECGEEWRVASVDPLTLVYAWEMEDEAALDADEDHPRERPA